MEAFLERLLLELAAIIVQMAIFRFVQWLRQLSAGGLQPA